MNRAFGVWGRVLKESFGDTHILVNISCSLLAVILDCEVVSYEFNLCFLTSNDVEHLFMGLCIFHGHLCILFGEMCVQILCSLLN